MFLFTDHIIEAVLGKVTVLRLEDLLLKLSLVSKDIDLHFLIIN